MTIKNSRTYNALKFIALVVLPAMATLYFALAEIWDFPRVQEVVYTIIAVDTVLGVMLQISTAGYSSAKLGSIVTHETPGGGKSFTLDLEDHFLEDIESHDEIRFKVRNNREGGTMVGANM